MTLSETDTTVTGDYADDDDDDDEKEEVIDDLLFSYDENEKKKSFWKSLVQIEIVLPLCTVFFTNAEFQLYVISAS